MKGLLMVHNPSKKRKHKICFKCGKCEGCIRKSERVKVYRKVDKMLDAYAKLHGETTPVTVRVMRMELKAIKKGLR